MEVALLHRRSYNNFRCCCCHFCPSGLSDDDPVAHASGEGARHQANGRGCRGQRPRGDRKTGERAMACYYRLEGVVAGTFTDIPSRRPVVQRVLSDIDRHAGL